MSKIQELAKELAGSSYCEGYSDDRGCYKNSNCSTCNFSKQFFDQNLEAILAKYGYCERKKLARYLFSRFNKICKDSNLLIIDLSENKEKTKLTKEAINKLYQLCMDGDINFEEM